MAVEIPRALVEHMLLGPLDDRRQMQDSPILGDVWIAFARQPDKPLDLLITPFKNSTAGEVAVAMDARIERTTGDDPSIAFLQGVVAARLYFEEVLRVVVPMTHWWQRPRSLDELSTYLDIDGGAAKLNRVIDAILVVSRNWETVNRSREKDPFWTLETRSRGQDRFSALDRYVALAGLVLWAWDCPPPKRGRSSKSADKLFAEALRSVKPQSIANLLIDLFDGIGPPGRGKELVYQVSLNRTASPAILRSVPAVKGDAARTLFSVCCEQINWAVVDSGIDSTHPAFMDKQGKNCRVLKSFDFTQFRRIVNLSNRKETVRKKNIEILRKTRRNLPPDTEDTLKKLAEDAREGFRVNWRLVEKLVVLEEDEPPPSDHGTHVAGIIGASRAGAEKAAEIAGAEPDEDRANGMCPDIKLYDFRVLAPTLPDTEFGVMAALQYIRDLNERHRYITIHGVNLSLSIPHDVRNYACGRTPVCLECEQMVESGIVVVAAAGNRGYQSFETKEGSYEGYAALSLTDPGNADGVITVGATHRYSPHTYGVSFFSSRGPTGDGRPKPDLVAPGERIRGPLLGSLWGDLDGTSMAAPHVSGAAAMLMARYPELIGQPRRIKRILCESATDLGRERSFQGRGMLDVLRAFQSV